MIKPNFFKTPRIKLKTVVICALIFAYSIFLRMEELGNYDEFGSVLAWVKQWYFEGPINLNFGLYDYFYSLEARTLEARRPYISYPPGLIFVPWLVATLGQFTPTGELLVICGWFNHLIFSTSMATVVWIYSKEHFKHPTLAFLTINAFAAATLMRGPMAYFSASPVHDVIGLSWLALYMMLASLARLEIKNGQALAINIVRPTIAGIAILTDWFAAFFILTHIVYRNMFRHRFKSLTRVQDIFDLLGIAIALFVFVATLVKNGNFERLVNRGLQRANLVDNGDNNRWQATIDLFHQIKGPLLDWNINGTADKIIGVVCVIIVFLMLGIFLRNRAKLKLNFINRHELLFLSSILTISCISYNLTFVDHSLNHLWSGLKFSVPFILFFLTFYPLSVKLLVKEFRLKPATTKIFRFGISGLFCFGLTAWWVDTLKHTNANFTGDFSYEMSIGKSLKTHLGFYDIVVSSQLSAPPKSIIAGEAEHVINPVGNLQDLALIANCLRGEKFNFVFVENLEKSKFRDLVVQNGKKIGSSFEYHFYRINSENMPIEKIEEHIANSGCDRYIMR